MKPENPNSDAALGALLRKARSTPSLPPRFQEGVWRRIEESEITAASPAVGWLEALTAWAVRPRFALAVAVMLICAGSLTGIRVGNQARQQDAQSRYLASVAPNSLR